MRRSAGRDQRRDAFLAAAQRSAGGWPTCANTDQSASTSARVVVSSSADADARRRGAAQVHAGGARAAASTASVRVAGARARACRRRSSWASAQAHRLEPGGEHRGVAGDARGRSASAPRARDRPRTCWRRRPAAPAPCRCCGSPSRAGCAARASAARGGRPARPCASTLTPTSRPGIERLYSSLVGEVGGVRAAVAHRHAEALRVADAMSAPSSPGGTSRVSASRSAATIAMPPVACTASISGFRSCTAPLTPGYCSSTRERIGLGRRRRPGR